MGWNKYLSDTPCRNDKALTTIQILFDNSLRFTSTPLACESKSIINR